MIAVDYHLKSQEDKDPRKKQVYKNISKTAELKSDIARKTEEGRNPKYDEAISTLNDIISSNESINYLSQLERIKK